MNAENRRLVARLAGRRWGIVARTELLAAGVSDAAIRRALASGSLRRLYPGVYFAGVGDIHPFGWMLAALLAVGGDGVIFGHRRRATRPPTV